ncbi:SANT/Myb domain [Dillenia turbinata]|uniref:SANT/Myb domain n=1 Tax=Dillenia turbinata TaxID=194707 RepID=A0AAN8VGE1_9MAGN
METLSPISYFSNTNWYLQEGNSTRWTREENKRFESALAIYDEETPDRWLKVAAMIPGKSVSDVQRQYMLLVEDVSDIEAGLVPIPGYFSPSFTLDLSDNHCVDALNKLYGAGAGAGAGAGGKRMPNSKPVDQERKKGVPWTEEEHRRFLLGLQKHGKGDWRNISRNFVISKTPTQVASHAQKYFLRQSSGGKEKRRPSIHDITTINFNDTCLSDENPPYSQDQPSVQPLQQKSTTAPKVLPEWNHHKDGALMVFEKTQGNLLMPTMCETATNGLKQHGQNLYSSVARHGALMG